MEASIISLLIFIGTRVAANILTGSGSQVDTFLLLLAALYVWVVLKNAMQSVSDAARINRITRRRRTLLVGPLVDSHGFAFAGEDAGWADSMTTAFQLVSQILVLLTFQVAGNLILIEWNTMGITTQEALVTLFLTAIIFFPVFLWIHRTYTAHVNHYRRVMERAMQRARVAQIYGLGAFSGKSAKQIPHSWFPSHLV